MAAITRVNLGGEGEAPDAVNVQPGTVSNDAPLAGAGRGQTLKELAAQGHVIVKADNTQLPFADGSVDEVVTNNVPIDRNTHLGPDVQTSEIDRILKPGGKWVDNGIERVPK